MPKRASFFHQSSPPPCRWLRRCLVCLRGSCFFAENYSGRGACLPVLAKLAPDDARQPVRPSGDVDRLPVVTGRRVARPGDCKATAGTVVRSSNASGLLNSYLQVDSPLGESPRSCNCSSGLVGPLSLSTRYIPNPYEVSTSR